MQVEPHRAASRLDIAGLLIAGLVNTFLALAVAGLVLGPGTEARESDVGARVDWIAEHTLRWQGGWLFWVVVTLSFAWSYFALGRNLNAARPWAALAIGVALIAAAVDLVGVLVNLIVLPELADALSSEATHDSVLLTVFESMERLAYALTNVAGFALYTAAGLLLLPAALATAGYPPWLLGLGAAEWGIAAIASALLIAAPDLATGPLLVSFALYAPWVWGSALWLYRERSAAVA